MKKPVALLMISMMILTLTAFSFADNGNSMKDKDRSKVDAFILDDDLFITVWLDAELGEQLEKLSVEVFEDGDVLEESDKYDESEAVKKFNTIMYKYTFEAIEYTPMDDFEVIAYVELEGDESDFVLTKKVDLEDLDEDDDDEDDEEDMDDDMYPAAPAIANKLLKDAGIPNRVDGVNLIAAVATEFSDADKADAHFAEEVEDFLIDLLEAHFDDEFTDLDDFAAEFSKMDITVEKPKVNNIKVEVNDVDNNDDDDDDDDNNDDNDDDDDDDDDDDNNNENQGKGKKK